MMRKSILFLLIAVFASSALWSVELEFLPGNEETIELQLENVNVIELDFDDGNTIEVSGDSELAGAYENGVLKITAPEKTDISLELPNSKSYKVFLDNDLECVFSEEQIELTGDEEYVLFSQNMLIVHGEDGEVIKVSEEGIFVTDEDGEKVRITKEGIFVCKDGEEEKIEGFWGSVIGSTVRGFTKPFIKQEPKTYIIKVLNDEDLDWSF